METTAVAPGQRDIELLRAMAHRIDQQDPGAFNNLGVLYHRKGLFADAVEVFLRALALDPRMRTAARNLEITAAQPGACDARLLALTERLELDPDDTGGRRERARLLRLIGRAVEATQQLDALIANDPDDGAALFERGLIEQRAGDLRRAQRWFERAVNASPADPIAQLHLAEVLYQRGQNEQALEALEQLLQLHPDLADAHLLHGFVLGDMGRHESARAAARQAASLNPALQTLQVDLSLDATPSTQIGGDTEVVADSASVEADSALARYGLGLAFRQRGYFDEARREFMRALACGDDLPLARHAIAELDLLSGRCADAIVAYERLVAEFGDSARYWNEYGAALHQSGDAIRAAESYRRSLRLDPRYALAYNNLGVALETIGDASAAREALKRASELEPTVARSRLNLARWYVRHRDPLAALTLLREIVAFQPNDADVWYSLGVVLQTLHRRSDAVDAFTNALVHRADHAAAKAARQLLSHVEDEASMVLQETQQALGLAADPIDEPLAIGIDVQSECPDAAGAIDLFRRASASVAPLPASFCEESVVPVASEDAIFQLLADADTRASRGELAGAQRAYDEAARLTVNNAAISFMHRRRAIVGAARVRCRMGDGHVALLSLRTLAKELPDDAEVIALLACSAAAAALRGDVRSEVAPTLMRRVLRMDAPGAALLHFVGDVALSIGDSGIALALYRRALAEDPSRPSPRVAIARVLRLRGDVHAARLELSAALAAMPGMRDALLELARVEIGGAGAVNVVPMLARHCAAAPADSDALSLLHELFVALDRGEDARIVERELERVGGRGVDRAPSVLASAQTFVQAVA